MKAVVVYDTYFGNTQKIAEAIGAALEANGGVKVVKADAVQVADVKDINLLIIGSPTRAFKATSNINGFIKSLDTKNLSQIKTAVFDTRINIEAVDNKFLKFMEKRAGYATDSLVKLLERKGFAIIGDQKGFFVEESEGPLREGEIDRAAAWAKELAAIISA